MSAYAGRLQWTGWRWVFLLLMGGGVVASFLAVKHSMGSIAGLSDGLPWGLCLGLNVFCGIALAAGALSIASVASLIGGPEWRVVGRASLLAGSLGYVMAMLGSLANSGNSDWPTLIHVWTPGSVLSGALWTVMLLALLVFLEFFSGRSIRFTRSRWYAVLGRLALPMLILVTLLAVVHQFGLEQVIRLSATKFSPLWAGPSSTVLFYLSSVAGALAVLLFASWRSRLAFGRALPAGVQSAVARLLMVSMLVYLLLRLTDLMERGLFWTIFGTRRESVLILLEIVVLTAGITWAKGNEHQPRELYVASALIIAGVLANRLNTAITALEVGTGQYYLPQWGEFLISYSLIAVGVAGFALGVKNLEAFPKAEPLGD
jgi:hypothetical protein